MKATEQRIFARVPECKVIPLSQANAMLNQWHYLGGLRSATLCLGFEGGCTVWGVMRSRAWYKSLIDQGFKPLELIRMVGEPRHTWATSSLLAESNKLVFAQTDTDCLITYADPLQNHTGAVYRAANWKELPERAQPDGYTWKLDGKTVSRKRFYAEFGSSAFEKVQAVYGDRIIRIPDIPKSRFVFLKNWKKYEELLSSSKKKKTWGAARIRELTIDELFDLAING